MSVLIAKSKENLSSAKLLIDNGCFASSVHCSYYSSFQLMTHLILTKLSYSQESLDKEIKNDGKGSHVFAINKIHQGLKNKSEILKAVSFNRTIGILKNKRINADYSATIIDKDYSDEALVQANEINGILSTVYSIEL